MTCKASPPFLQGRIQQKNVGGEEAGSRKCRGLVSTGVGGGLQHFHCIKKSFVIVFLNYFEQPLLGYIAYLLIVNHLTVLPSAQAQSYGNKPRHLVYALVYSREYKKGLILISIMSQLRTAFFFVFALFESLILSVRMQYRH